MAAGETWCARVTRGGRGFAEAGVEKTPLKRSFRKGAGDSRKPVDNSSHAVLLMASMYSRCLYGSRYYQEQSVSFIFVWIRAYGGVNLELFSSTICPTNRTRDKERRSQKHVPQLERRTALARRLGRIRPDWISRVVLPSALLQDGPGTPSQITSPIAKSKAKADGAKKGYSVTSIGSGDTRGRCEV